MYLTPIDLFLLGLAFGSSTFGIIFLGFFYQSEARRSDNYWNLLQDMVEDQRESCQALSRTIDELLSADDDDELSDDEINKIAGI